MVTVADDTPAAEACICKPCSAGHVQGRIMKFGSRKHNPAWSLSVAQLVVELTVSRRANDTWWQRYTIDVNPGTIDVNPDDGVQTPGTVRLH